MKVMTAIQQPSGLIEHRYGEGNFNRTAMLYLLYKSQGCRPDRWLPGSGVDAVREGERLCLHLSAPLDWPGSIRFRLRPPSPRT
jgi:hypothetical protein